MEKTNQELTYEELSISNMFQIEALYRLMMKKGLITEEEFINEWKQIKEQYDKENKK